MTSLLKFMIILFAIYYVIKLIVRIFLPTILKRIVTNMTNNFDNLNHNQYQNSSTKKEGDITVDYIPQKKKKNKTPNEYEGEYTEYEEVK